MTNATATTALVLFATLLVFRLLHLEVVEMPEHIDTFEHIRHALHAVKHHYFVAARFARH